MFDNIGRKIQGLAVIVFTISFIGSIILGIYLMDYLSILAGVLVILLGALASYLAVMLLYAFGTLVDDVSAIRMHRQYTPNYTSNDGWRPYGSTGAQTSAVAGNGYTMCSKCRTADASVRVFSVDEGFGPERKTLCANCRIVLRDKGFNVTGL